jgi:ribosome-binding factor A
MNNIENINKEISVGIKKAQAEISSFIEQSIKSKKSTPELSFYNKDLTSQGEEIGEII